MSRGKSCASTTISGFPHRSRAPANTIWPSTKSSSWVTSTASTVWSGCALSPAQGSGDTPAPPAPCLRSQRPQRRAAWQGGVNRPQQPLGGRKGGVHRGKWGSNRTYGIHGPQSSRPPEEIRPVAPDTPHSSPGSASCGMVGQSIGVGARPEIEFVQ